MLSRAFRPLIPNPGLTPLRRHNAPCIVNPFPPPWPRPQTMLFHEIAYGSADFRRECSLPDEILRKPLGLSLADENLAAERDQLHFGLFDADGELVGCIVVLPLPAGGTSLSPSEGRGLPQTHHALRSSERRRVLLGPRGAAAHKWRSPGTFKVAATGEGSSRRSSCACRPRVHTTRPSRPKARGAVLREKLGYRVAGEEFIEVTIPHSMEKTLVS